MLKLSSLLLLLLTLVGCGGANATPFDEPVTITGKLTLGGKPVNDVSINLQPTGPGLPATLPVTNGSFEASITPGTYTWYVSKGASKTAEKSLSQIPAAYQQGSLDRQLEVSDAGPLEFAMN
jgi:hypothetical protein